MSKFIAGLAIVASLVTNFSLFAMASAADFETRTISDIESLEPYQGGYGSGFVYICPGTQLPDQPRNILIQVHGFSPNTVNEQASDGERDQPCSAHDQSSDYHLIDTQWRNGGDYIQRNAGFIRAVIQRLIDDYGLNDQDKVALVGYSMGGLVARYALLDMQTDDVDHPVDLFITVDSPHEGAYVPIGVQHLADIFKDHGAKDLVLTLDVPAARQMLIYHYTQGDSPQTGTDEHVQLFDVELGGRYPSRPGMRTVAIASGRSDGGFQAPMPGERYFGGDREVRHTVRIKRPIKIPLCGFTLDLKVEARVLIIPQAWALGVVAGEKSTVARSEVRTQINGINIDNNAALSRYFGQIVRNQAPALCAKFIPDSAIKLIVAEAVRQGRSRAQRFVEPFNKVRNAFNDGVTTEGAPGGLAYRIQEVRDVMAANEFRSFERNFGDGSNMFIPTYSALGIKMENLTTPANLSLDEYRRLSPFEEKIYTEDGQNRSHLETRHQDQFKEELSRLFSQ